MTNGEGLNRYYYIYTIQPLKNIADEYFGPWKGGHSLLNGKKYMAMLKKKKEKRKKKKKTHKIWKDKH